MSLIMPVLVRDVTRTIARFTGLAPARRLQRRQPLPVPTVAPAIVERPEPSAEPSPVEVEQAAKVYFRAADHARRAEREKRAAKKILDRVSAGLYGTWRVERVASARQVADLEAIRATYKRLGLGAVPMKTSAPSLKVTVAEPGLEAVAS